MDNRHPKERLVMERLGRRDDTDRAFDQEFWQALAQFGAPLENVKPEDFSNPQLIYQIGIEPIRVDIIMSIEGVSFADAWASRVPSTFEGVPVNILGKAELIRNKQAVDRPQDRLDVDRLKGR